MPSILILIPSFDNKHTINVTVYIGFDVYVQFQRKEREECQGVYLEEDNIPILKAGRMKTEENKMCNLENIRSGCFLLELSKRVTQPNPARPETGWPLSGSTQSDSLISKPTKLEPEPTHYGLAS